MVLNTSIQLSDATLQFLRAALDGNTITDLHLPYPLRHNTPTAREFFNTYQQRLRYITDDNQCLVFTLGDESSCRESPTSDVMN